MAKQEFARLQAEVAETVTVIGSARALISGLAAKLRDAAQDPAEIRALADELDAHTNDLAAAVAEHTVAEDETPPGDPGDEG